MLEDFLHLVRVWRDAASSPIGHICDIAFSPGGSQAEQQVREILDLWATKLPQEGHYSSVS